MTDLYVGIDLGGTDIKVGIVTDDGKVLSKFSQPTEGEHGPDHVLARMCDAAEKALAKANVAVADVKAIGVGAPGALDHANGVIIAPPNLPGWKNVPVRASISKHFNRPATLENDANAAAWGEYWIGAAKGTRSLVMFTLGTGVGGGIIINHHLLRGFFDNAGELGHMLLRPDGGRKCGCGQTGCMEAYASASHTARIITAEIENGKSSSLKAVLDAGLPITTALIVQHKNRGDALANEIWQQTCKYIAMGCINVTHVINPEMIVLAGGMSHAGNDLLVPVMEHFERMRSPVFGRSYPKIGLATLGNDAGFIGAAGLGKDALENKEI
jgi:glucokinase